MDWPGIVCARVLGIGFKDVVRYDGIFMGVNYVGCPIYFESYLLSLCLFPLGSTVKPGPLWNAH